MNPDNKNPTDIQPTLDLFARFRETTAGDGLAAAFLTVAQVMQDGRAFEPTRTRQPAVHAQRETKRPPGHMVNLQEAAEYLGYSASGLRKIVSRSKVKQGGGTTHGVTIKYFQARKNSEIKFRQEWLDAFVAEFTTDPSDPLPPPYKPKKKLTPTSVGGFGFDLSLLPD